MSRHSARIERAAQLLDTEAPGWTTKIDLDTLDMSSVHYCILGQAYGDYFTGLRELDGEAERKPGLYGFYTWGRESFDSLTAAWRDYLRDRRESEKAA